MVTWIDQCQQERQEKDEFFANHPHPPIPHNQRENVNGLEYYPPDASLRFEVEFHEFDERDTLRVETTQDGAQTYARWEEFRFDIDGVTYTLTAFKSDPDEVRLWVPFRDETNGEETYGAGRYLDLEASDRTSDSRWILDFNRAYSPFCAYSDAYECPLVPAENWLEIRIQAGEKGSQ